MPQKWISRGVAALVHPLHLRQTTFRACIRPTSTESAQSLSTACRAATQCSQERRQASYDAQAAGRVAEGRPSTLVVRHRVGRPPCALF
eukprot:6213798-Pleurochrysis_carterae.AAC.4